MTSIELDTLKTISRGFGIIALKEIILGIRNVNIRF